MKCAFSLLTFGPVLFGLKVFSPIAFGLKAFSPIAFGLKAFDIGISVWLSHKTNCVSL